MTTGGLGDGMADANPLSGGHFKSATWTRCFDYVALVGEIIRDVIRHDVTPVRQMLQHADLVLVGLDREKA